MLEGFLKARARNSLLFERSFETTAIPIQLRSSENVAIDLGNDLFHHLDVRRKRGGRRQNR